MRMLKVSAYVSTAVIVAFALFDTLLGATQDGPLLNGYIAPMVHAACFLAVGICGMLSQAE